MFYMCMHMCMCLCLCMYTCHVHACACSGLEEACERLGGSELGRARFVDAPEVAREPRRRGSDQSGDGARLHPHAFEAIARPVGSAVLEEGLVEPKGRRELPWRRQRQLRQLLLRWLLRLLRWLLRLLRRRDHLRNGRSESRLYFCMRGCGPMHVRGRLLRRLRGST